MGLPSRLKIHIKALMKDAHYWYFTQMHPMTWIFKRLGCPKGFWPKFLSQKAGQVEPFLSEVCSRKCFVPDSQVLGTIYLLVIHRHVSRKSNIFLRSPCTKLEWGIWTLRFWVLLIHVCSWHWSKGVNVTKLHCKVIYIFVGCTSTVFRESPTFFCARNVQN